LQAKNIDIMSTYRYRILIMLKPRKRNAFCYFQLIFDLRRPHRAA